ncbi:MAG: helix-turn-helix transcriptional regulator [Brucellaceae bacterium]|nr:helix-turn-helix transcriptional regulator [Brucellaceae bacterium]MCO5057114.1 helix-turn-helix domain-containing protein [Rhizobiaceae bacterium]
MPATRSIYSSAPDMDTMGGRLSRARDATGLTVAQLARRVGVKTATIQAWESDRSQPRANRLATLAGVLNVSLSWVLHGIGTAPAEDNPSELVKTISVQLERLKRLQEESEQLVAQIEDDLARFAANG